MKWKRWHYYRRLPEEQEAVVENTDPVLTGTKVTWSWKEATAAYVPIVTSRSLDKKESFNYDPQVVWLMNRLASQSHLPLVCYGELRVKNQNPDDGWQIYRAEPHNQGIPWNDWGMFRWSEELGEHRFVLGHMKCFMDLRHWPEYQEICILMEIATPTVAANQVRKSRIFEPWVKEESDIEDFFGNPKYSQIELVPVLQLAGPAVVVPDLANDNERAYLRMVQMWEWADSFNDWLHQHHYSLWEV